MQSHLNSSIRTVRYGELRPCFDAFIDTRTPGSNKKENFTIIGPGVSENPNQHVHITEPHGFNVGGVNPPVASIRSIAMIRPNFSMCIVAAGPLIWVKMGRMHPLP